MGKKRKTIYFDYLRVFEQKFEAKANRVIEAFANLDEVLEKIKDKKAVERTYVLGNDIIRIQSLNKIDNKWEILLLRLREEIFPGIADNEGNYEIKFLEDGKYYCEATTLLYDIKKSILVFQRNRYGIQFSGLEIIFNEINSNAENSRILLKPIIKNNKISILNKDYTYTTLQIAVENLAKYSAEEVSKMKNTSIIGNMAAFRKYKSDVIELSLGYGRTKKKEDKLDSELVIDTVNDLHGNIYVKKLKVAVKFNEDTRVETIDLLDDRINDHILLEYSKENPITHERIISALRVLYPKKIGDLKIK